MEAPVLDFPGVCPMARTHVLLTEGKGPETETYGENTEKEAETGVM